MLRIGPHVHDDQPLAAAEATESPVVQFFLGDPQGWAKPSFPGGDAAALRKSLDEAGVRAFDASLGGFGGCPYAPGATGNIVMEDLVFLLETMGLKTGVDLDKLVKVREIVQRALPTLQMYGNVAKAGLPKNFARAA